MPVIIPDSTKRLHRWLAASSSRALSVLKTAAYGRSHRKEPTMGTSKNQRRAQVGGGKGGFERAREATRFIPTAAGARTYVLTPAGKTINVAVGSEEFIAAVAELRDAEDRFFEAELAANDEQFPGLGWDAAVNADAE